MLNLRVIIVGWQHLKHHFIQHFSIRWAPYRYTFIEDRDVYNSSVSRHDSVINFNVA